MTPYLIWIVLMAIATITITTVGTLAAAGTFTWQRPDSRTAPSRRR